jgi:hypothetical protein
MRALATAAACAGAAIAVVRFDIGPEFTVPVWTVLISPLVYVALAVLTLGRASLSRRALWFVTACTTHAVLALTTTVIVAVTGPDTLATALPATILESPLAVLLFVVGVPLTLLPFRDPLFSRPPARAAVSRPAQAPLPQRVDGEIATGETPFAREARRRAAEAAAASMESEVKPVEPVESRADAVAPPPAAAKPARGADEAMIRIPFGRISSQLPADAFLLPMNRVAETMRSPHEVLVPRTLVVPQLGEGVVEVAWALVEDQFPALAFALELSEIHKRYPDLRLSLPLDLVVKQLPPGLYTAPAPPVMVEGLEHYPLPFQPTSGAPVEIPAARRSRAARATPPPVVLLPPPVVVPEAPARIVPAPAVIAPPPPIVVPEAPARIAPAPAVIAPPPPVVVPEAPAKIAPAPPVVVPAPPPVVPRAPARIAPAPPVVAPAPPAVAAPIVQAAAADLVAEANRIGARLTAFGPLDAAAHQVGEATVLSLVTPQLPRQAIERAAARCAPLLRAAQQVTIRTERAAMVLMREGAAVVVVALRPHSPVALLEILATRACVDKPRVRERPVAEGGLAAADIDSRVAALGEALQGFGPVVPAAFVDAACGLNVYVFSAGDAAADVTGAAARAVWQALVRDGERELGPLTSVVLREGPRRTVVRPVAKAPRPAMLAAVGVLALPGLAYRQVERAADQLAEV